MIPDYPLARIVGRIVYRPDMSGPPPDPARPAAPTFTPAEVARATAAEQPTNGPELWAELHRRALAHTKRDDFKFLVIFEAKLPCGHCRADWGAALRETPPRFGPHYFAWTVETHNSVNRRLGKPEFTVADALALWRLVLPARRAKKGAQRPKTAPGTPKNRAGA